MKSRLTSFEKKILSSFDRGEWKGLGKKYNKKYETYARRQLKEKRINIRLAEETLNKLRQDAEESGMPYQTLIASVLHRYANGRLQDARYLLESLKILK